MPQSKNGVSGSYQISVRCNKLVEIILLAIVQLRTRHNWCQTLPLKNNYNCLFLINVICIHIIFIKYFKYNM